MLERSETVHCPRLNGGFPYFCLYNEIGRGREGSRLMASTADPDERVLLYMTSGV